ncbi:MAG: DUF479 domain-containing protein [Saprospiraceae bacterium]|nr:DUF479 domain-containing protein [Saprospiraceae bacterium]
MNHLAHCFLSFDDEDLLLGNFIGDFVKGNDWQNYPEKVQQGILLHRTIDSYTDNHPMTDRSVARVRPYAGRYSPPFTDILYDHLLALHWEKYTHTPFDVFAQKTYRQLETRAAEMPAILQERLPKMIAGQFLHGYTRREGLEWVLDRFSLRLAGNFDATGLSRFFFEELNAFSEDFNAFFPDLLAVSKAKITPVRES